MVTQIAQQQIPLSRFLPLSLICFSQLRALLAYNKKSNRNNNIGGTACVCNYTVAKMKHNTHTLEHNSHTCCCCCSLAKVLFLIKPRT